MTPEELLLVREVGTVVAGEPRRFADHFYAALFEISPRTRSLFPDDLAEQKGKLVAELGFLIAAADDVGRFVERARELGQRHVDYGVTVHDYANVRDAMIRALSAVAGDAMTEPHLLAWSKLYRFIADAMLEGASETSF